MKVTVESTGALERRMRVELPAEKIQNDIDSRLKSVGRTAKIKGFRPGKIPPKVVRRHYGAKIREEVLAELIQKSYGEAVTQEKLSPAGRPKIEQDKFKQGDNLAYVAIFEVLPEFKLKNLNKLKVDKPDVSIGKKDIDGMVEKLRKQKATWSEVDRKSRDGDRVVVDFNGTLKGEPFQGGQGTEVPVILGQSQMLPDFEKALFGLKAGDEKSFKVKFPKDYPAAELAGKKADFAIKTHRVEEEILPPVDDALAKQFQVEKGGIKQLLKDVEENMNREAAAKVQGDLRERVMTALMDANPIEIPQTLKQQEMHTMQHEAMERLGVKDHDQAPPMESFAESAEKRVRLGLLFSQLISDQQMKVDAGKVRAHVEAMCASYEDSGAMVDMYMNNPQVVQQVEPMVLEQQAIEWLLENGEVKTRAVTFTEYMNS